MKIMIAILKDFSLIFSCSKDNYPFIFRLINLIFSCIDFILCTINKLKDYLKRYLIIFIHFNKLFN